MNYFVNVMGSIRCAFYIPELWLLTGPEGGYKISETCRPVNSWTLSYFM